MLQRDTSWLRHEMRRAVLAISYALRGHRHGRMKVLFRVSQSAALVLTVILVFSPAITADFEAGRKAWDAGRPAEALAQWRAAADAGDRRAMLALGRLYLQGLGAPQDYVLAHMWFNLAASRGEMAALKEREGVAAKMTPQQLAAAQERAREWRPGGREADQPKATAGRRAVAPPRRAIREAQESLRALGYKPGPADGKWGDRSAKAYGAFLRDAALPPGDTLTPEGLRAVRAAARRRRAGTATGSGEQAAPKQPLAQRPRPDALHRAVLRGNIDGLKATLEAGADVNARDGRGWTALMHAANKGYKLMVGPLLKANADPDVQAADGATALFMATVHGHSEIIELLVKAGTDIWIKGPKGKTVVDVAESRGDPAVFRALRVPETVVIPAGSLTMMYGNVRVTIQKPFVVGKYEVTFAEWDACVAGGGCNGYRPGDRRWGRGRRPVINVGWKDAKSYVEWLSRKTGKRYRLLSEAEWEYVARAGTETKYHWGDEVGENRANCIGCGSRWDGDRTAPVGSFPANDFGLYDVHGNVWEWVEDCWHRYYSEETPSDGSAWTSGGDCGRRMLRGGSWNGNPWYSRSAIRLRGPAGDRFSNFGFRIARTLTP